MEHRDYQDYKEIVANNNENLAPELTLSLLDNLGNELQIFSDVANANVKREAQENAAFCEKAKLHILSPVDEAKIQNVINFGDNILLELTCFRCYIDY